MVHGESFYYADSTSSASTWHNSRRFCQGLGADLVVIKSEDENRFVYDLLSNTSSTRSGWIGLYRKAHKKFYWLDDRPEEGNYQKWNDGEPSGDKEDCVELLGSNVITGKGKWNDIPCSNTGLVSICQRPK